MPMKVAAVSPVLLAQWPALGRVEQIDYLGSGGGLSGSEIWGVRSFGSQFCLKRWPSPGPAPERLRWIHAVLWKAAGAGLLFVPAPARTKARATCVELDGSLWELAPWLPGEHVQAIPTQEQTRSALGALARFHLAVADMPAASVDRVAATNAPIGAPSPTAASRRQWLAELLNAGEGSAVELWQAADRSPWLDLRQRMAEARDLFPRCASVAWERLQAVASRPVPLQPVVRDVWRDNLLFTDDDLSGLVDYGAMRCDSVACDVSRALGSLAADDPRLWQVGLAAYRAVRELTENELQLVSALDAAAVALTCLQWAKWLCVEGRQFTASGKVLARIDFNLGRMRSLGGPRDVGRDGFWLGPLDSLLG